MFLKKLNSFQRSVKCEVWKRSAKHVKHSPSIYAIYDSCVAYVASQLFFYCILQWQWSFLPRYFLNDSEFYRWTNLGNSFLTNIQRRNEVLITYFNAVRTFCQWQNVIFFFSGYSKITAAGRIRTYAPRWNQISIQTP